MNKRKRKKMQKKQEIFIASWANSYRELKKLDREYHEYVVSDRRKKPCDNMYFENDDEVK